MPISPLNLKLKTLSHINWIFEICCNKRFTLGVLQDVPVLNIL